MNIHINLHTSYLSHNYTIMYMTSRYNYNIHALFIPGKTAHAAVGRIALVMCLAAASGGITQCIMSGLVQIYNRHEEYNTNEIANAVLANLVAVTGCCPFIEPSWAILIGRKTCCCCSVCIIQYCMCIHVCNIYLHVHCTCTCYYMNV